MKCPNCGAENTSDSLFCEDCGAKLENSEKKSTSFEGELYKCPACGEMLNSFSTVCPSCKYEIRGRKANSSIKDFAKKLLDNKTDDSEIILYEPIPNTVSDLIEFALFAHNKFNLSKYLDDNSEAKAWLSKIDECYAKAKVLSMDKSDFNKIESLYSDVHNKIDNFFASVKNEDKKSKRKLIALIITPIIIVLVILLFIGRKFINNDSDNNKQLDVYSLSKYNKNTGYDNDYKLVVDKQSTAVYRLKIANIANFVIYESSEAYNEEKNCYVLNSGFIKQPSFDGKINDILAMSNYSAQELTEVLSEKYNLITCYETNTIAFCRDAVDYINDHLNNPGKKGYNIAFSTNLELYIYDIYDALKDSSSYYYTFNYNPESFKISLCDQTITLDDFSINEMTINYNKKTKLEAYTFNYSNDTEYKITDSGFNKNHYETISLASYMEDDLSVLNDNGYTTLKILLEYKINLKYKGYQEIRLCNNDDYANYIYTQKQSYTEEVSKYYSYSLEYNGTIADILSGKLYIFYDASGSGDDDWFIKNLKVTFTLSEETA